MVLNLSTSELMKLPLMSVAYAAVLLLPIAGCASRTPPQPPQPAPAAVPVPAPGAETPAPDAATPAPKRAGKATPPVARTPAPNARAPKPAATPVAARPAPAAPATLDLTALKEQLKATKAIGVFTKISLKNQVDDLMDQFRAYYQGKAKTTMPELRRSYDLLMMKVLSLLQDSDQKLASEIVTSREAIWALLSDQKKFATLQT
jgi:hypothetical protein